MPLYPTLSADLFSILTPQGVFKSNGFIVPPRFIAMKSIKKKKVESTEAKLNSIKNGILHVEFH